MVQEFFRLWKESCAKERERPLLVLFVLPIIQSGLTSMSGTRRRRREFAITDTELKLMAAAASIRLSRMPKNG